MKVGLDWIVILLMFVEMCFFIEEIRKGFILVIIFKADVDFLKIFILIINIKILNYRNDFIFVYSQLIIMFKCHIVILYFDFKVIQIIFNIVDIRNFYLIL